jgi:hypothetical protein
MFDIGHITLGSAGRDAKGNAADKALYPAALPFKSTPKLYILYMYLTCECL